MNTIINRRGMGKQLGAIIAIALLIAVLMSAIVPMTSVVYGAAGDPVTVVFYDYGSGNTKGNVLKTETVNAGQMATPPPSPSQKGMKFLGWDKVYEVPHDWDVSKDYEICAVYELSMTTEAEDEGKLAKAKTANPPKEETTVVIASPTGEAVTVTTDSAIVTNSIIAEEPSPLASGVEEGVSTQTIVLGILAAVVALGLVGYIIFITKRRRNQNAA